MPGSTYFDTAKRSFKDVTVTNGEIATGEFLEASESVVALFDLLGSTAFAPVQKDMTGNIKKIRDRETADPDNSKTLQSLVKSELAEKKHTATEGLLWLNRGLTFTALALRKNCNNPSEELSVSFTSSYGETLKKHHNMLVKGVFSLAMKACPYRADFYKKLGNDEDEVKVKLEEWLTSLELCIDILGKWIETVKW